MPLMLYLTVQLSLSSTRTNYFALTAIKPQKFVIQKKFQTKNKWPKWKHLTEATKIPNFQEHLNKNKVNHYLHLLAQFDLLLFSFMLLPDLLLLSLNQLKLLDIKFLKKTNRLTNNEIPRHGHQQQLEKESYLICGDGDLVGLLLACCLMNMTICLETSRSAERGSRCESNEERQRIRERARRIQGLRNQKNSSLFIGLEMIQYIQLHHNIFSING